MTALRRARHPESHLTELDVAGFATVIDAVADAYPNFAGSTASSTVPTWPPPSSTFGAVTRGVRDHVSTSTYEVNRRCNSGVIING